MKLRFLKQPFYLSAFLWMSASLVQMPLAQALTLEQYKKEVKELDSSWKAAELAEKGSSLLESEADSLTGLQFTSQMSYLKDKRPTQNPAFQGDQTQYTGFLMGVKQQTLWGMQWSLTQNYSRTHIYNAAVTAVPVPEFYDAFPKLEFTLPLWRNLLGREIKAQTNELTSQLTLRKKQMELSRVLKEIEIENAFFNVLAQQQIFEIQKDSLTRAEKLQSWTQSRIDRNLTDKSDIYQAQSAVAARKMEMLTAQKNLSDAIEKFNSFRKIQLHELKEKLTVSEIETQRLNLLKNQLRVRKDVSLKKYQNESLESSFVAQKEKHKPQLNLSVMGLHQSRDKKFSEAQSNLLEGNKDELQVALTLNVPLNQLDEAKYRDGYEALKQSQSLMEKARKEDESLTWENTVHLASQLKQQLTVIRELEGIQKNKSNAEQDKFNRGRSTLFQVLSYEQDYLSTRSQRINMELQIRQFLAQLSMFE
jgi:outer membrane protein TolC